MTAPLTSRRMKKVKMLEGIIYNSLFLLRCQKDILDSIDYFDLLEASNFLTGESNSAFALKKQSNKNSVVEPMMNIMGHRKEKGQKI